jgi:hypothetical protein
VHELDRLPLAITAAGQHIREMRAAAASTSGYTAANYLAEQTEHSSSTLLDCPSTALRLTISRTPPPFRELLEQSSLIDAAALPRNLLLQLISTVYVAHQLLLVLLVSWKR